MRKSERIAGIVAAVSVGGAGLLGVYTLNGPVLSAPIVVTVPDAVLSAVCPDSIGCYLNALPDFIWVNAYGKNDPATLPHEMLHYTHPDWDECDVSTYLYADTGLTDGYHGRC